MKKMILTVCLLVFTTLFAACGPVTPVPMAVSPAESFMATLERPTKFPEVVLVSTETPAPIPGGFPQAAFAAREALAKQLGVNVAKIEIRNVEPVEWPDGCLGLAGPDEFCTQAIVPGYRVTLVSGTTEYIYRASERGSSLRQEKDPAQANLGEEARPFVTWQSPDCDKANILKDGLSYGKCGGPMAVSAWQGGIIPDVMLEFLNRFAAFAAETPAGKLKFNGLGTVIATPVEQRAIAEWMKLQFMIAQSGRTGPAWGLAFAYSRSGGIAGFCDDVSVYLDGSVTVSSCKGVNSNLRLTASQLETLYAWYDGLKKVDYSHSDPATADAMTIKLVMTGQGQKAADDVTIDEIQAFCAGLITQARSTP